MTERSPQSDHQDPFAGSDAYLRQRGSRPLASFDEELDGYLARIGRYVSLTAETRILEIGVGTGWLPVLCARRGLPCDGLELNPQNLEHARALALSEGATVEIAEGSVETFPLPAESYDVVIAMSVFEHVRDHRRGLGNVYRTLKPGGLLYFYSTNKFSFVSGEYPGVPLYGWLPYRAREWLRVKRQGPDIVRSSGIDFNQFTYWGLKRTLREIGFTEIHDQFELLTGEDLIQPSRAKRLVIKSARRSRLVRTLGRMFATGNLVIARK